ncbi:ABC transporter ATP-binding protein [Aeromicrobium sp. 9AM]|uniref:ABC transporter ATP-binding protein n=1 Tax=Aeromicrobium sp. 9AM TaxID=2653126 RepID=UPI0012F2359A|nr:ATP-binding cassette domain-containing protein [Aeromicrobium sp. 9AM]VXB08603.1 High-affinity branched-chain amino acid transport ATP-binding protein BraG [Aeromicrobium sp. 9AM]
MIELQDVTASYGRVQALFGVSLSIHRGQTVALVGTNGAGKTTVVRSILGLVASSGSLRLEGRDLAAMKTHDRVRAGNSVVHEGRGLLGEFTVMENLVIGGDVDVRKRVDEALDVFPDLRGRLHDEVALLSGGQQQMVALGRAMLRRPNYLLLDEPALGLAPVMVDLVYQKIAELQSEGMGVLLVEQSLERAKIHADELCLLKVGRIHQTVASSDSARVASLIDEAFGG